MPVKLTDQHVDKVLNNPLLLPQGPGGEVVAELLPHLAVMVGIPNREKGVGLSWCRPVPIALDEESISRARTIDVFPRLRRAVREFIRSSADNGSILIVELFDLIETTALDPARDEPELFRSLVSFGFELCASEKPTGVAAASLGPG